MPQTENTISWIIDELNDEQSDQHENYIYNLSMVLVEADPALLLQRESAILESQHFLPDLRAPFSERLQMLSWGEATCWTKLEEFCEEGKGKQYINEVNWMEPLAVRLAGEAHLDSTVPLLVTKLIEDGGDLLNQECARALARIGTSNVLEAIFEVYPKSSRSFRIYATEPLEHIHSDLAVEKCLKSCGGRCSQRTDK